MSLTQAVFKTIPNHPKTGKVKHNFQRLKVYIISKTKVSSAASNQSKMDQVIKEEMANSQMVEIKVSTKAPKIGSESRRI